MRTRRHFGELLGVAAIVGSLTLVAILQLRWVDQLANAERERLRTALERGGRRLAAEIERETAGLLRAFAVSPAGGASRREELAERWRGAALRFDSAEAITALYFATTADEWQRLAAFDQRWEGSAPPAVFAASRIARRRPPIGLIDDGVTIALALPLQPRPFAERAPRHPPLGRRLPPGRRPAERVPPAGGGMLLIALDPVRLRTAFLEPAVEHHFGPAAEREAALRIVRIANGAELLRTPPAGLAYERSDLSLPLHGRQGFDLDPLPRPGQGHDRALEHDRARDASAPWLLQIVHRAGSLEAAVARTRRRQLSLAGLTLLLLALTSAWLVVSARRARRLAQQRIDFVAGLTHELHTPLAAIRSAGDNLAAGVVHEPERLRQYGDLLVREGRRLQALVGQALDLAGMEHGEAPLRPQDLDVREALDAAERDAAWLKSQHGVSIRLDVAPDTPAVLADPLALRQVLGNLVENAIKHGGDGATVTLRARPHPPQQVALEVEDQGPGIAKGELGRVFEPFFRGRAARQRTVPGSGIGLALVRRLVERQGGAVSAHNTGGGALLRVVLPAADGAAG